MPRLFVALPVPEEIADDLVALQSGVPDARWVPPENFHVTLCFAGEVQGGVLRDLEEELSDIAGPPFPVAIAGVEQFSSGKQPRALVATRREERPARLAAAEGLDRGAQLRHRGRAPQVPPARHAGALRQRRGDRASHLAQFMASHSTFRAGPWIADHFALYSSRSGRRGSIYTEEAAYGLTF